MKFFLKQAKKIGSARIVQARECLHFGASHQKKHIVLQRPYAIAASASEESFSIFCDVLLENATSIYKNLPSECFREKRIFCLFKTHMIFVNNRHENINLEGNSSCKSSKIRLHQSRGLTSTCFLARPRPKMCGILVIITCKIPFIYPSVRKLEGCQTPSNDFSGYGTPHIQRVGRG